MNTVKHAPAPWIAERGGTISAEGKVIATVQMGFQHNASLIASAPELLAALRELLALADISEPLPDLVPGVVRRARAALAKAAT